MKSLIRITYVRELCSHSESTGQVPASVTKSTNYEALCALPQRHL